MNTKTYEDWSKYLGVKPHRLGVVARMYTDNTLNFLTDGLRNVFYKDEKADQFQTSSSLMFEWEVETNNIKHVMVKSVEGSGQELIVAFGENYYQKYDIFRVDETKQQFEVISRPIRKSGSEDGKNGYWEVVVRLIDNGYDSTADLSEGMWTTFQSVAQPELSEEGKLFKKLIFELLSSVKLAA